MHVIKTPLKDLMELTTVFFGFRCKSLAHLPEVGLIPAILPFQPCLGTGAHHVFKLAAVPQHEEKVTESGVDVDVLGIFGWSGQINAHIA
jgi:hypothetical protein